MEHERVGELFNYGVLHMEWPTALFIFVVFMITMFLLNRLLFVPIIRTLEAREAKAEKNKAKVDSLEQKIIISEKGYQEKVDSLHKKLLSFRQQALNEATEESKAIILEARQRTEKRLANAEQDISTAKAEALSEATQLTGNLAKLINLKAIG
jgi:F-type H+-transporting ATPase subunit b